MFLMMVLMTLGLGRVSGNEKEYWISSDRVTNWGIWGIEDTCPEGTYVNAFQLKTEPSQESGDDTALNGIRFTCGHPHISDQIKTITSSVGSWGRWGKVFRCSNVESHMDGFFLRAEMPHLFGDDTASNNLKIKCKSDNHYADERLEGDGLTWGEYYDIDFRSCAFGYAICGLQTQVEPPRGAGGDDTALNNIKVKCCPFKIPTVQ